MAINNTLSSGLLKSANLGIGGASTSSLAKTSPIFSLGTIGPSGQVSLGNSSKKNLSGLIKEPGGSYDPNTGALFDEQGKSRGQDMVYRKKDEYINPEAAGLYNQNFQSKAPISGVGNLFPQQQSAGMQSNQPQIQGIQNQLNQTQDYLKLAQDAGYSGNQQFSYNAAGGLIPANQSQVGSLNTNPYQAQAPSYSGLVGGLAGMSTQPTADYTAAQDQYRKANEALAQLKTQGAEQGANIEGSRTNLTEAGGESAILQNLLSGRQAALTGEMTAAQQAAQVATGQQSVQQAGLGSAAGFAAPQPYGITNVPYNPTTGQFGGIAGAGASGGGVFEAGNITGELGLGQQSAQTQAIQRQTQNLGTQLSGFLDQNPDINTILGSGALTFTPATGLFQLAQNLVGNPKYQTFSNLINDLISRYSAILTPAGANQTDARLAIAQSLINPRATPQSIKQVIGALDQQAQAVVQGLNPGVQGGTAPAIGGNQGGTTFGNFFGQ